MLKMKHIMTEGKSKFDIEIAKKISKLTDANNHTEASVLGAKMLGLPVYVKKFELIGELEDLEGHSPEYLNKYKYSVGKEMDKIATDSLSKEELGMYYDAYGAQLHKKIKN